MLLHGSKVMLLGIVSGECDDYLVLGETFLRLCSTCKQ